MDFDVLLAAGGSGGEVVRAAFDVRTGGEDRGQGFGGVAPMSSGGRWRQRKGRHWQTSLASATRLPTADCRLPAARCLLPTSRHVLRRPLGDQPTTPFAGLRTHVDHPVGRLDHVEIMFNHDDRIAEIDQSIQHVEQLGHVVEVQAGRRLVEQEQRPARVGARQFGRELDALGLAAAQGRGGLTERQIIEATSQSVCRILRILGMCWKSWTARPHDMSSTSAIDWP